MPLPASLTVINLRGTFLDSEGNPGVGSILVYSEEHLVSSIDNTIVAPLNFEAELNSVGYFSVDIPATNDPQWGPANFTYTVKENLTTGVRSYKIAVPYDSAGGVLDLADVSPVVNNPAPAMYVLVSTANQLGGYPRIDAITGKIPSSVIPAGGGEADGSFKGTWSGATAYIAGDIVIRTGVAYGAIQNSTNEDPATQTAFWTALPSAPSGVTSFNSRTGAVVPATDDYAVADVAGLTAALAAKANLAGGAAFTGAVSVGGQAVVVNNDARLSDARTPTAHASSHASAGGDPVTLTTAQITGLDTALTGKTEKSTLTTKGDIYVATASATPARLPVGTDGQVFTADSSTATGTKWATPSGGGGGTATPQLVRYPLHNQPPTSNPAGLGWVNNRPVLTFADTPSQVAIFTALLPASYAGGGLQVRVGWAAAAVTGTVGWLVSIERIGTTLDTDTDSFASDQTITAATVSGTSGVLTVTSVTIADGADMDSLAAGELFRIRITRDTANDNAAGLAYLHFVEILEP